MRRQFSYPAFITSDVVGGESKVSVLVQRHNGVLKVLVPEGRLFSGG